MICPICDIGRLKSTAQFERIGELPIVTVQTWLCDECGVTRETQTREGVQIDEQYHRPRGDPRYARYHRQ